jgi:hypothetical protein
MFSFYNETVATVWPDNASGAADYGWDTYFDCPFAEHMMTISWNGVIIVICIGIFMFCMTLALSYFSLRKWRQVDITPIANPVVRSWKDTIVQVTIIIEFFQFVAIAPAFLSLKVVIEAASNIFMLDVLKVAQEDKTGYWTLLQVICILCYLWFFLVMMIMLNAENWLRRIPFLQRTLALLNGFYLPFFGNTMFLPFSALLLDCFICDKKAQGYSVVSRDCYMNCWTSTHNTYVIMAILGIAAYEPVAVFSRPLWQQAKTNLNLMSKPYFLLFKTCMQILLIVVGNVVRGLSAIAHGCVFSFLILIFAYITYRMQPFNYGRCNLWEVTSLLGVGYISILATLSNIAEPTNLGWFVALIIGWGLMIAGTLAIQKGKAFPNYLVPPDGAKNKRKVYDALALGHKGKSFDMDNSVMPFKGGNDSYKGGDSFKHGDTAKVLPLENLPPSPYAMDEDVQDLNSKGEIPEDEASRN